MWLREFLEKYIFIADSKPKKKKKKQEKQKRIKKYCKCFKKGTDGFCINYVGSRKVIQNCAKYCDKYK